MVRKLKNLTLSHRKVLVIEIVNENVLHLTDPTP